MSKQITLSNDFHNTSAYVRAEVDTYGRLILNLAQYQRAMQRLCGMSGCACGGVRGPGQPRIEPYNNHAGPTGNRLYEIIPQTDPRW